MHALRISLCAVRRVLFMQIGERDLRLRHRYTLREWFLLTAAYALLVAVLPAMFDLRDQIRKKHEETYCRNGLWQLGIAVDAYEKLQQQSDAKDQ